MAEVAGQRRAIAALEAVVPCPARVAKGVLHTCRLLALQASSCCAASPSPALKPSHVCRVHKLLASVWLYLIHPTAMPTHTLSDTHLSFLWELQRLSFPQHVSLCLRAIRFRGITQYCPSHSHAAAAAASQPPALAHRPWGGAVVGSLPVLHALV